MAEDIRTLIMRLQSTQYVRDMQKARKETDRMSRSSERLESQNGNIKNSNRSMVGSFGKIGGAIAAAYATRRIIDFSVESIKAASAAEETANKFATVFASMGSGAEQAAQTYAKNFDVASSTAKRLLGNTGDLLVGFGFSEGAALDLSQQVNTLAGDLASFTNIEGGTARASEALTKALVGETEQAKALGIVIRQGTREYKERVKQIMATNGVSILQAKAMANLEIAVEQSQKAQGDYNRTQESTANLMKSTNEAAKGATESFGSFLKTVLPVNKGLKLTRDALKGVGDQFEEVNRIFGEADIRESNLALFGLLGDFDASYAGEAAQKRALQISRERREEREKLVTQERRLVQETEARATATQRMIAVMLKEQEALKARQKAQDDARKRAREAETRRTEPLRDLERQLKLQRMINKGREREAYIQRQVWAVTRGRTLSQKELNRVMELSGQIFDAMRSKRGVKEEQPQEISQVSRSLRLAGAALSGSAEAARTRVGAGATVEEDIERNTKMTAKNTEQMTKDIRRMSQRRPAPANFGRRGSR